MPVHSHSTLQIGSLDQFNTSPDGGLATGGRQVEGSQHSHENLSKAWASREFEPQIHHIRFPLFRNLEPGLRIDFQHPITALVGPNGTNKSSILRALQGCPDNENIGHYWFGTALDEITPSERHRFIHGRYSESNGDVVEVMKTRIQRKDGRSQSLDPDYFETSRPLQADGMATMPSAMPPYASDRTATRWKAVSKPVTYMDFRAEISAFDKCFYHGIDRRLPVGQATTKDKKRLIQRRSFHVRQLLSSRVASYRPFGAEWLLTPAYELPQEELAEINYILGKQFTCIEVTAHLAFGVPGVTVRLHTNSFAYSEAWAGSGEFAVVQLVTGLNGASDHSLVLLDEPEVSLHPGAQERLSGLLIEKALVKKLQIVFATHSPLLVKGLPVCAIKVLGINKEGRIELPRQASSPREAFVALEHRVATATIIVEDELAKLVVDRSIRLHAKDLRQALEIQVQTNGAGAILAHRVPELSVSKATNVLICLDGDQKPHVSAPQSSAIADDALESTVLEALQTKTLPVTLKGNSPGERKTLSRNLVDWMARFVIYLPGKSPEEWLLLASGESEWQGLAAQNSDSKESAIAKEQWRMLTAQALDHTEDHDVTHEQILAQQERSLAKVGADDKDLQTLADAIRAFAGPIS